MEYVILTVAILSLLISVALLIIILKNKNKKSGNNKADGELLGYLGGIADRLRDLQVGINRLDGVVGGANRTMTGTVNSVLESSREAMKQQNELSKEFLQSLKRDIERRLEDMSRNNERKLEEMQKTVNEKLAESLDSRIKLAFNSMNDRLDAVQKNFSEVEKLSGEVVKLNGVLSNVKNRGVFGEVSLENILSEILTPEQYYKQKSIKKGSKEAVDFAVVLPGQGAEQVLLPIDAKFPLADYERLTVCYENNNALGIEEERKSLLKAVKLQAKSIMDKYIDPPSTTDFAIMFLPTEGLFAEVVRTAGFTDMLRRDYKVIPCGPTTVSALLNSLMIGFTTLKIQKKSAEIVKMMKGFGKDFDKLLDLIDKVRKNSESISSTLELIDKRNNIIKKSLDKLELTSGEEDETDDVYNAQNQAL